MDTPSLKIKDDIEFPKVTTAKQLPGKTKNWTTKEIEITAPKLSELKPRQGVLPSDLRTLYYHRGDIHNLNPKIRLDMAFQK
jgi:hypothetical protein